MRLSVSASYKTLLLFVLFVSSWFAPLDARAQTGEIMGRVVYEDGGGAPNVSVTLISAKASQQSVNAGAAADRTITDADGKFKFTGLAPGVYSMNVSGAKGYVGAPASEAPEQRRYRVGDNVTITMIRGGVITGRVTTADGEPMVGVRVHPVMARDAEGRPVRRQSDDRPRMADDRGVYRLYGLAPGTYLVYTLPDSLVAPVSPYEGNVATYHPSSTRDTAAEITVASGGEATGIDIRHRGARGRAVSGTVSGFSEAPALYSYAMISLTSLTTRHVMASQMARSTGTTNTFAIYGVPDGDYEIIARHIGSSGGEISISAPRRVTVRGADVIGIGLRLPPAASISGKILFEAARSACENERKSTIEEVALSARGYGGAGAAADAPELQQQDGSVNDKGDFSIYNLRAGRYFIEPELPNENWFVKSIASNASGASRASASTDIARSGVTLKSGEKLTGVTLTVAGGGASLRGRVGSETEGAQLPPGLRVHLIPAETTAKDDALRYAEAFVRGDGTFALNNIAPGKYWLMARAAPDDEPGDRPAPPVAWDANERAKLRKEAEAMKIEVELKPCQRIMDQALKYSSK